MIFADEVVEGRSFDPKILSFRKLKSNENQNDCQISYISILIH